jgi:hypothetical protein
LYDFARERLIKEEKAGHWFAAGNWEPISARLFMILSANVSLPTRIFDHLWKHPDESSINYGKIKTRA